MPDAQDTNHFWHRLRSRKIVQWGIAYVAASWGVLQGLQFLAGTYGWSTDVLRFVTLAFALGLPVALTLAWFHGDRDEQRVTRTELAILTLLFLVGGAIFWRYARVSETPAATGSAAAQSTTTAATPLDAAAPDAKSIAVLPFVDMSVAKDQEYMSDGIAEELLNLLAQVPDLKVIARTSSFAFKGEKIEIAEIAKKLSVAHVLEGSVRKSGNKLRITAQLIRTADSTHLWSETYDRPLDDIFAVQDDIANAIVQALQIRLAGGPVSRREGGTQNLEAYQLYLRAVSAHNQNSESSLSMAAKHLEQAVKLDPSYGLAWVQLAWAVIVKTENGYLDPNEGFERARQLAQHALQLSPDLAGAHAPLQTINLEFDWDWAAAETQGQRAREVGPMGVLELNVAGRLAMTLGRWDDAERYHLAALVRDPLNTYEMWNLGTTYYLAGRFADSERMFRRLLEVEPGFAWTRTSLGKTLLAQGKPEAALAMVQQNIDESERLVCLPIVLQAAGRKAEADEALKAQIAHWAESGAYWVAGTYAHRGDHDLALEWLERAYKQKDVALIEIVGEPLFNSMADDPRFKAFLRKMKLPESAPPASDPKGQAQRRD